MSVGKSVGVLADKMLKLTGKAVKKLEDYGNKSAEENDNDNARKLAAAMNKLGKKLEEKHNLKKSMTNISPTLRKMPTISPKKAKKLSASLKRLMPK